MQSARRCLDAGRHLGACGMPGMNLRERLVDPHSPERRPRRAAYALPTLFTAGNIFLGFISSHAVHSGRMLARRWQLPARSITSRSPPRPSGSPFLLDGLDGRIARITNTTSDFGREMDSLADVISFGIAPAVLAYRLGRAVHRPRLGPGLHPRYPRDRRALLHSCSCCAAPRGWRASTCRRIPIPKNPGRPEPEIFRRACRFPRRRAWSLPWFTRADCVADSLLAVDRRLAGAAGRAVLPDGQYLALLQLQGSELTAAAIASDDHSGWRSYLSHLELFATGAPGVASCYVASGIVIRIGGNRQAVPAPRAPTAAGASGWLGPQTLALVGSESLMGREIRDLLSSNLAGTKSQTHRGARRGGRQADRTRRRTGISGGTGKGKSGLLRV